MLAILLLCCVVGSDTVTFFLKDKGSHCLILCTILSHDRAVQMEMYFKISN